MKGLGYEFAYEDFYVYAEEYDPEDYLIDEEWDDEWSPDTWYDDNSNITD